MDPHDCLKIRLAVADDWQTIKDFNIRLAAETEAKSLTPAVIEAGVKTLLQNPNHGRYFVACQREQIVGQMMHTREWSDWRNGEIWWLQSVYVHPEHRRQGIFRSLYRHLEELAQNDPNVIGLRLYAESQNAGALEVYRSLGLQETGYIVLERFFRNLL